MARSSAGTSNLRGPTLEESRKRRWRDYRTPSGRRPVKEFLDALPDADVSLIVATMREVALDGLQVARHLRGEVHEVRADGEHAAYRILFAEEGRTGRVLLALLGFSKKSRKTPPDLIALAERRLRDWRSRPSRS